MTEQEKSYFSALSKDRAESANMLEKPSMRGIKNSVVEKYSDQAHFIYELLQNADDAKAINARFILEPSRLIFAHDGKRHFSVSNPDTEDNDSANGCMGDINAITSIANSNKTEASIGKFGVGFKAVFQYTSTPHIYDPNFRFKIDRFIVPILIEDDIPLRHTEETMFVFPFDHPERNALEAYSDISDKLRNLSFPLLFLTNLKSISFEFDDFVGLYGKEVKQSLKLEETTAEQICLTQNDGNDFYDENLWLFSRSDDYGRTYSVGFFMDKDGNLKPVDEPAFCFFPTKETTALKFIIHAPFLLTDSREGIRAGVPHNDKMIGNLSRLAGDSFEYLRDIGESSNKQLINDDIVSIIPYDKTLFSNPSDKRKISFLPFYNFIRTKFENSRLLPTTDGCVVKNHAYWAEYSPLTQMFSNEQLPDIVGDEEAHWVLGSRGYYETARNNRPLYEYFDTLVETKLNEEILINGRKNIFGFHRNVFGNSTIVKGITDDFIEKQPLEWLHKFYKWISEGSTRTKLSLTKPIFLDQNKKAAAAYDSKNNLVLFLPIDDFEGYRIIHPDIIANEDSLNFVKQIGITTPSLKDQIYNIILPIYQKGGSINTEPHFKLFFNYYCECSNAEIDEFISLIKKCKFLRYETHEDGERKIYRGSANEIYYPTPELKAYFSVKENTNFLLLDEYVEKVGKDNVENLNRFLRMLGIKRNIEIIESEVDYDYSNRMPVPHSTRGHTYKEKRIDGCIEILSSIDANKDFSKSVLLWNCLLHIIEMNTTQWSSIDLDKLIEGRCFYFYRKSYYRSYDSKNKFMLKNSNWLMSNTNEFLKPYELSVKQLADNYDTTSNAAQILINFLNIQQEVEEVNDNELEDDNLTDEQRKQIRFAEKLKEAGIESEEDINEFLQFKRMKEAKAQTNYSSDESDSERKSSNSSTDLSDNDIETIFDESNESNEEASNSSPKSSENNKISKEKKNVLKDIARRTKESNSDTDAEQFIEDDADADEYMPSTVDYSKKIERAKQKSAAEIDKITHYEELHNKAANTPRYSYGWFKALLEMESINSGESNDHSKEVSISFGKVERDTGTSRTLILKYPNRYIPQFMEDLADIPLVLHIGEQTKTVAIEVANIVSYTLRVKMKSSSSVDGVDLSQVTEATIDAKSPAFLLEELKKEFNELKSEFKDVNTEEDIENFNMQENLCENIEFVFGPPGTGKTTHLAKNVLIPMMQENDELKVLVLTPTNKSADVLVKRIMEVSGSDTSYEEWLLRFGATGDDEIEKSPVFKDKTYDITKIKKNVTVTTIARFPYDFFMPNNQRIFLNGIYWDYIVIDEASMIPLANIVYPLYKKTPKKFIIAGDPFQIEPITSVALWKNENIYTMVKLNSFENPQTIPHNYKVELLTTQYRSIPDIGYIFSNFAYGGILKHFRTVESQRPLNVGNDLGIETLNIIKFPVSKYESIYRCKRLQHSSSYQVYSALFTYEYVCYLAKAIAANNPNQLYKIGIIAPYRAQADMIDKLIASEKLPKEVEISVGTIHGFQGDECDIIFAVFNTPPKISASNEMFLNKKNIINVSISRARDYLFIVMPNDDTENISNLRLVKRVECLIHKTDTWNEFLSPDLEDLMFEDSNYLENNAFSTSHQSVNVYGLPEKKYEVRTEDTAVDVQIHRQAHRSTSK